MKRKHYMGFLIIIREIVRKFVAKELLELIGENHD